MGVGDYLPLFLVSLDGPFSSQSVTESLIIGPPRIRVLKSVRVPTAGKGNRLPQGPRLVDSSFEFGPIRRALDCDLQGKSVWT